MYKGILKIYFLFIFLHTLPSVISRRRFCNPTPPICADDCDGNGYYVSEDGTVCIQCPQCPAGQELNKDCGNGLSGDASCIPCPQGFFSLATSKRCTPCATCTNTVEQEPCQPTQNRVCGDCLPGFVRRSDRFSADPSACPDRCSDLPRDTPQCRDWWISQEGEAVDGPQEIPDVNLDVPAEVVPLNDPDRCEPEPPHCIDPCHEGNYFLDYDGLCKACLTCQPGEQLNKVCGRGKNGDAYCRPCPKGTFSEDGLARCSPCKICVNTVASECTASRNTECGECLPGFYQDADGYFPDSGACPNKCPECPNTVPQCQKWCESKMISNQVTVAPVESIGQDSVTRGSVKHADTFLSNSAKEINDEANPPSTSHWTYMTIFTVLASLLAVTIVVFIIVFIVFHSMLKRRGGSNASTTTETQLLPSPSGTPSPTSSPARTPPTVYSPTTYPIGNEDPMESFDIWKKIPSSTFQFLGQFSSSRPVSVNSNNSEYRSSEASTPTLNLNRRLANIKETPTRVNHDDSHSLISSLRNVHHRYDREVRMVDREETKNQARNEAYSTQSKAPGKTDGDKMYNPYESTSSSGNVVAENDSGTVHPLIGDVDRADGRVVRRRRSSVGLLGSDLNKIANGRNGKLTKALEAEAALYPNDSSSENGLYSSNPEVDTYAAEKPNLQSQSLKPTTFSHISQTDAETKPREENCSLTVSRNKTPVINSAQKNPTAILDDSKSPGVKSPSDNNVTININMNMKNTEGIDTLHIGNVKNKRIYHECAYQTINSPEAHSDNDKNDDDNDDDDNDDDGETTKFIHANVADSESDAVHVGDGGKKLASGHCRTYDHYDNDDDDDNSGSEGEKFLDHTSS